MSIRYMILLLFAIGAQAATLEEMFRILQMHNPALKEDRIGIEISALRQENAGLWENPVLGVGMNDLLIDDIAKRDLEPMQTQFVTLSQKIPTAGKRGYRSEVAASGRKIAKWQWQNQKRMLHAKLARYAYAMAVVERKEKLLKRYIANLQRLTRLYRRQISVGKSVQEAVERAGIVAEKIKIRLHKLQTAEEVLRYRLEKILYRKVERVEVSLQIPREVSPTLHNHPLLLVAKEKIRQARTLHKLSEARRIPDLKVGVGYHQRQNRTDYLSLNLSMPLPVRGREQRESAISQLQLEQQKQAYVQLQQDLGKALEIARARMEDARKSYRLIRKKLLPRQRYLQKILEQAVFTKTSGTADLIDNLNDIIDMELDALEELQHYFDAYATLIYFQEKPDV